MPPQEALPWAIHHLATAIAELDAAVARRLGLTASDYVALKHLLVAPLGPVELGRMLGLTSGAATGLVTRLASAGYAERTAHPGDRRRQIVTATPRAEAAVVTALQPLATDIDRLAAALPADRRDLVAATLGELTALHRRHARP